MKIDPYRLIVGALVALLIGVELLDIAAPHAFDRLSGGVERMFTAAVGLLIGPALLVVSAAGIARHHLMGEKIAGVGVFYVALPFAAAMTWVFFFR